MNTSQVTNEDLILSEHYEPKVLPIEYQKIRDGFYRKIDGMTVITSIKRELDNKLWLHVSLARPNKLPSWNDVLEVKNLFIGDKTALQVLPKKDKYIDCHKYCFHLWHCIDGDVTPDFTRGNNII